MQSQELTRSPVLGAVVRDAALAMLSAPAALLWLTVLVLAVPIGLLYALADSLPRAGRFSFGH